MTPRPPAVVLFDVMNTLVYDPIEREIPDFFELSLDELYATKHPDAWPRFERGEISETTFYDIYLPDRSERIDGDRFRELLRDAYRWLEGMESIVATLANAGVSLHAFSNYPVWYRIIDDKLDLSRYLSWTFVSCNTGCRKPNDEAYRRVVTTLDTAPESCLFVDDRRINCDAARKFGFRTICFEGTDPLVEALQRQGLM